MSNNFRTHALVAQFSVAYFGGAGELVTLGEARSEPDMPALHSPSGFGSRLGQARKSRAAVIHTRVSTGERRRQGERERAGRPHRVK